MPSSKLPSFLPFAFSGAMLFVVGMLGLVGLIDFTVPTLGPRWLFFFFAALAASGLGLIVFYFIHWRFPSGAVVPPMVIVREAILAAVYVDLLVWLQLGRVLSVPLAVGIAFGFVVIELAIRLTERSRFRANEAEINPVLPYTESDNDE
ncbi:MAG TPA: hypothetical protein PKD55_07330 [Bellilinea sp.]|nr:hypothetical protein [Bellilinea sp.]